MTAPVVCTVEPKAAVPGVSFAGWRVVCPVCGDNLQLASTLESLTWCWAREHERWHNPVRRVRAGRSK